MANGSAQVRARVAKLVKTGTGNRVKWISDQGKELPNRLILYYPYRPLLGPASAAEAVLTDANHEG